ncbi:MAG TPA: hypothetical protein VFI31_09680 [Pirellulales bacterium]|nr:hypothetical protein [Pirellulales bacterium]
MRTVDLANDEPGRDEIFQLAEEQNVLVRTAGGRLFIVAEVGDADGDDFAEEIGRTRANPDLRQLLAERSREPGLLSLDEVRQKLGLS